MLGSQVGNGSFHCACWKWDCSSNQNDQNERSNSKICNKIWVSTPMSGIILTCSNLGWSAMVRLVFSIYASNIQIDFAISTEHEHFPCMLACALLYCVMQIAFHNNFQECSKRLRNLNTKAQNTPKGKDGFCSRNKHFVCRLKGLTSWPRPNCTTPGKENRQNGRKRNCDRIQ